MADFTQDDLARQIRSSFNDPDAYVFFADLHEMIIVATTDGKVYVYDIDSDDDAMYFTHLHQVSPHTVVVVQYPELSQL